MWMNIKTRFKRIFSVVSRVWLIVLPKSFYLRSWIFLILIIFNFLVIEEKWSVLIGRGQERFEKGKRCFDRKGLWWDRARINDSKRTKRRCCCLWRGAVRTVRNEWVQWVGEGFSGSYLVVAGPMRLMRRMKVNVRVEMRLQTRLFRRLRALNADPVKKVLCGSLRSTGQYTTEARSLYWDSAVLPLWYPSRLSNSRVVHKNGSLEKHFTRRRKKFYN